MPIPTELVGSLPRPERLQNAYRDYDDGKIDWPALQAEQDAAAEDSIRRLEATGEPIVTDGEQRESSVATYSLNPPVLRRRRRARVGRLHRGPPGQQERLAQSLDRQRHAP